MGRFLRVVLLWSIYLNIFWRGTCVKHFYDQLEGIFVWRAVVNFERISLTFTRIKISF